MIALVQYDHAHKPFVRLLVNMFGCERDTDIIYVVAWRTRHWRRSTSGSGSGNSGHVIMSLKRGIPAGVVRRDIDRLSVTTTPRNRRHRKCFQQQQQAWELAFDSAARATLTGSNEAYELITSRQNVVASRRVVSPDRFPGGGRALTACRRWRNLR